MRVLFSAGEASGDAYAGALARTLRERFGISDLKGIAGRRFESAGGELIADSSSWGAIGIVQALGVAPRVYAQSRALVQELKFGSPGLFVPIDFGYLNVKLCRLAKDLGWRVVYFAPPGSWRRTKQGSDLPQITDAIITQFSWSQELLTKAGANAFWFGHPLKEMIGSNGGTIERESNRLAVLPGSRIHEVRANLEPIADAVEKLSSTVTEVDLVAASTMPAQPLLKAWQEVSSVPARVVVDGAYASLKRSRAAIVCSGTATLESALCQCPCVVVYRGSKWMEIEFRLRRPNFDFISLPNILLERPLVPELLQHDASPERIQQELELVFNDPSSQLAGFKEIDGLLGPCDAITRSAEFLARG